MDEGVIIQSWDTAFGEGQENDYSVCTTLKLTESGQIYVLDLLRGKWEYPAMREMAISHHHQHRPSLVLVENKASGISLIQDLMKTTPLPIKLMNADKSQRSRVSTISYLIEGGKVLLPSRHAVEDNNWTSTAIEECAAFPSGEHDDIVDSLTHALIYLKDQMSGGVLDPAESYESPWQSPISLPEDPMETIQW